MLNIVVALKVCGPMWRDARIEIHCNTLAVVQVLTSGGSRDSILSTCAQNIWLLSAFYNITIQFSHIVGVQNTVADLLSRWTNTNQDFIAINAHIPNPVWMNVHVDLTLLIYHIFIMLYFQNLRSLHFLLSTRLPRGYGLHFVPPHWLLIVEYLMISWPSWWYDT